jgi:nitrogen fixation NifU-like protein
MTDHRGRRYPPLSRDQSDHVRSSTALAGPNRHCARQSRTCGDHVAVWLRVEGNLIAGAGFESLGCALCRASASFVTERLKG